MSCKPADLAIRNGGVDALPKVLTEQQLHGRRRRPRRPRHHNAQGGGRDGLEPRPGLVPLTNIGVWGSFSKPLKFGQIGVDTLPKCSLTWTQVLIYR